MGMSGSDDWWNLKVLNSTEVLKIKMIHSVTVPPNPSPRCTVIYNRQYGSFCVFNCYVNNMMHFSAPTDNFHVKHRLCVLCFFPSFPFYLNSSLGVSDQIFMKASRSKSFVRDFRSKYAIKFVLWLLRLKRVPFSV